MHVLILNQTFYPDVAATAQLMWDLAQHLSAHGHRVSAVTSRNFYGTTRRHELAFEKIDTIEIHRLGGTAFGKKNIVGRLADFASYYVAAGWHLLNEPAPDVILSLTSPPMVATLAMLAKQFLMPASGRPPRFVYHIMDLYPEAIVADGMTPAGSLIDRGIGRLTARTLEVADGVIVLGRDMRDRIIQRYRANPKHVHVVTPWGDSRLLWPLCKADNPMIKALDIGDSFNIVYSGNFGNAHDADTIFAAIDAMRNDAGTQWLFIGGGSQLMRLKEQIEKKQWTHVRILPFQDRAMLNQSLNLADVHLVSQLPAFTGVVVPSKLFGILAVGKPAVMVGPSEVECSRVLCDHEAGFVVANGDSESLVRRLRQLREDGELRTRMGCRAREAFELHYDRTVACDRIEAILQNVVRE